MQFAFFDMFIAFFMFLSNFYIGIDKI